MDLFWEWKIKTKRLNKEKYQIILIQKIVLVKFNHLRNIAQNHLIKHMYLTIICLLYHFVT